MDACGNFSGSFVLMTGNAEPILRLSAVRKRFSGIEALKGIDLDVYEGEFFGFLGPNGAGKSTLMKILSGFLKAESGGVFINGRDVRENDYLARLTFGLVPQELALYDSLNPLENLKIFARLNRVPHSKAREWGDELLHAVGLWDRRHDRVKDFSGGMKRRLNIILSLLHKPEILLCDEPTVGVDPQSRNAIFSFLEERNREGLTILYTTHYMEEAERLCPRLAIIDDGRLLASGEREALLRENGCRQELVVRKGLLPDGAMISLRKRATIREEGRDCYLTPGTGGKLSLIISALEEFGVPVDQIHLRAPSLESLFLKLTGHRLRD